MKITNLQVTGYQGIGFLNLDIEQPVVLVAGKNATGKTSIRDAIQFALTGESSRVSLKKDYATLVRVGSDAKAAEVALTAGGFTYRRKVATGRAAANTPDYPLVLPHLLGNTRFACMNEKDQAALLFNVTQVKRDGPAIRAMMERRGISAECIEQVGPMLRAGFAAAVKSCKEKQSEARGAWEAVTEERFGEAKAGDWKAPTPATGTLKELQTARDGLQEAIPGLEQDIATLEAQKAATTQHTHSSGTSYTCPCCAAELIVMQGKLVKDEREDVPAPSFDEQNELITKVNGLRRELSEIQQNLATTNLLIQQAENADKLCAERTAKAATYFARYNEWKKAADALAPSGIPLQLLEAGLKPINDRLDETVKATGWKPITIYPDMSISYGGIDYHLCSESEQWRVDAAIVEAFALLSGTKLFVLDRMDVLHPTERGVLLRWITQIADQHDTILIMATLKTEPAKLPQQVQSLWLTEGGEAMEKAA